MLGEKSTYSAINEADQGSQENLERSIVAKTLPVSPRVTARVPPLPKGWK